jgi:hypothetical protein
MRALSPLWVALALSASLAHAQAPTPSAPGPTPSAQGPTATAPGPTPEALPPALAPELSLSLAPPSVGIGEVVKVKLEATVPAGVDVNVPEQSLSPFELVDRRARTEPAGDKQRFVFELDLIALDPGTLQLPALLVRVVGPKGELGEVRTSPRPVTVKSPLANEPNAKARPATAPRMVIEDDYTLAWVLGALAAAALIAGITLLVQRWLSRRPKVSPPPPPPRPAWEVALEKLEQLKRRQEALLSAQRGEEFIEGVGNALREYLGRRYGFDGLECTSDEIQRNLERLRPHKLSLSGVSLLLEQCDLVKFARAEPDPGQCDDLWNGAVGLVRATTPPAPEPAAAQPAEVAR